MKKLSVWAVVAAVACALCAGSLFAGQGKKKEGAAQPRVSQEEQFKKLDANNDGSLSLDEYRASLRGAAAEKAEDLFKLKDANKDGKLSPEEFRATSFEEFALKNGLDPKAEKITLDDMKKVARRPERAEQNFKRADKNGDGVITRDDFAKGGKKAGAKRGKKAAG